MAAKILWPWELPEVLDGVTVVADVWVATANITSFLRKGVKKLLIVNKDNVQKAKGEYKDALIIGESLELPISFFDASNFPSEIEKKDIENRTILYMSNNGSRIIELALKKKAKEVITVSFTNIAVISEYLRNLKQNIYFIAAGEIQGADRKAHEDLICIESLDKMLKGQNVDLNKAKEWAKSYIVANHKYKSSEQDLRLVFHLNSSKAIPLCSKEKEGWIKVGDLNKLA